MLATKMRALFQRRKGRDLFDLYWALKARPNEAVVPAEIVHSFKHYMAQEGSVVPRQEFLRQLELRLAERGFCSDMQPLLRTGIEYDPKVAAQHVRDVLLMLLDT